jgi:uncharacterized phiE125 gp8 family phage protein
MLSKVAMNRHPVMRTALICTAAGAAILSLADAKAHLRLDFDDDDDLIAALIATATAMLDGGEGWLKRALLTQSWRLVLPHFLAHCHSWHRTAPYGRIDLPLPPQTAVTAIAYTDPAGIEQTLDPSLYRLIATGTEARFIIPAVGQSWPAVASAPDAVKIDFTAGYGASPASVPARIVSAAKLLVSHLYETRSAVVTPIGNDPKEPPLAVKALISDYRILRF